MTSGGLTCTSAGQPWPPNAPSDSTTTGALESLHARELAAVEAAMANGKRYDVTIPRTYKDGSGKERTHFWAVGTAFPLKERDGFTIKLYSKMLITDEYVVFLREEEESSGAPPPDDDHLPF
jgi:hypothetical protein